MTPVQHSALPWRAEFSDGGGYDCMTDAWRIKGERFIAELDCADYGQPSCSTEECSPEAKANAEFIVRACNSHDELLAALKWADRQLRALVTEDAGGGTFIRGTGTELSGFCIGREAMRKAIANAEAK